MTEVLRRPGIGAAPAGPGRPTTRLREGAGDQGAASGTPSTVTAAGRPAPARVAATAARKATEARRPYHVGVFLGVSAGLYAVSLAGVTALQSSSEQAVAAARAPAAAAIDSLRVGHDDLARRIAEGGSAYESAVAGYQRAADSLSALERQLDALAASVGRVDGATSALPAHIALPSLPKSAPVAAAAPAVHATTGASGKP